MGLESPYRRVDGKFEGLTPNAAIARARMHNQEVRLGQTYLGPTKVVIAREGTSPSTQDGRIISGNIEKSYPIEDVRLDDDQQRLVQETKRIDSDLRERCRRLEMRLHDANRETYGENREGRVRNYDELRLAKKFIYASRQAGQAGIAERIFGVSDAAMGLVKNMKMLAYQNVIEGHIPTSEEIKNAEEWIVSVSLALSNELDEIEKELV